MLAMKSVMVGSCDKQPVEGTVGTLYTLSPFSIRVTTGYIQNSPIIQFDSRRKHRIFYVRRIRLFDKLNK